MEKRFYFRIELSGTGENIDQAWEVAQECFAQDPGAPPPLESELPEPPILGTEYSIDARPDTIYDQEEGT